MSDTSECFIEDTNKNFTNSHGQAIFCRYWRCDVKPKAVVFLCHGYCEHSGRYKRLASYMTRHGFMVFSHDHVGHGLSEGDRVHIDDFMTYVNDVIHHVQMIKDEHRDVPLFIYGHSMGGQISVLSVMERPDLFTGAILEAPLIMFDPSLLNPVRIIVGRILAKLCPQFPIVKMQPELITSDPEMVKDYLNDELCWHGYGKSRQCVTMLDTVRATELRLAKVRLPFLVMHGDKDQLTYLPGSQKLYEEASSTDKTLKIYPGAAHQLHSELNIKQDVERRTVEWIMKRL